MIITIAFEKGGVGKTTTAVELALAAQADGLKVIVVDTDPQQSATKFRMRRESTSPELPPLRVIPIVGLSVGTQIRDIASDYDLVIVDAGGRDSQEMRLAMLTSHIVVIPTTANDADTDGLNRMAVIINEIRLQNPNLAAWLFPSRIKAQRLGEARKLFEEVLARPISDLDPRPISGVVSDVTRAYVHDRVAFADAYTWGRSVSEMQPRDSKAMSEGLSLYMEIKAHG